MDAHPPPLEPAPPEVPDMPPVATWRKILWSFFIAIVIAPTMWLGGFIFLLIGFDSISWHGLIFEENQAILLAAVAALVVTAIFVRTGLKRDWPGRRSQLIGWGVAAAAMAVLLAFGAVALTKVRDSSRLKAMLPRQPAAAIDQFYLENPNRIFLKYDEMGGPNGYIKGYNATDGEDLSVQFPIRLGWSEPLSVRLPDGTTVRRYEVIAAIGKSGLIITYPLPQDENYDPKRVYRLDCGVSYQGNRVVELPPDPAGREGRDQDGVHTYKFPDGRRYEITYHGGVPDGPFHAYHADGTPWGEATYRNGRVVEAWLITRDGRKFDELKDGEAAQKAVSDSLAAASRGAGDSGRQKLAAKDYAGAIADLTRALAINPLDADLHGARGDAYRATGNLDEAINDYGAAEGFTPEQLGDYRMPEQLRSLVLARGRQRQQAGDTTGAARDFAAIGKDAGWAAEDLLRTHDSAGAMRVLDPVIAAAPMAELHAARADARRMLPGQQAAAEADYTQAIELARQGKMQIPANQRVLPAHWLYKRGHVRRWLGNFTGAAEDFRAALPQLGTGSIINRSDAALWLFLVQGEAGHRDEAGRELQATDRTDWWPAGQQTARFLLGEITESELDAIVAKSNQDGDRLKAELLSGLLRRQAGDEAGAFARFRQAARRTSHDEIAADAARREAGQALRTLAERELASGDFATATASLKEAVSIDRPATAGLLARYGDARRGAKDIEGAFATYNESLRAVIPGTEDALAAELREKIAALNAELESIRQVRAEAQKAVRPAVRQSAPGPPSPGSLMVEARNRAAQKMRTGDYTGAIADYNQAIELRPDVFNYTSRANARRIAGDLDGAIADYSSLMQLETRVWMHRFVRGQLRRQNNDLPGAAEDLRATIEACLKIDRPNVSASHAAFWLYLTECERGHPTDAAAELAQFFARMEQAGPSTNPSQADFYDWDRQVADLLLGRLTEAQLLANLEKANVYNRNDRRIRALFFSALRRRLAGDQPGAVDLFRQVLVMPNAQYFEWETAEARRAVPMNPP